MTEIEDDQNGRLPKLKTTKMEDDQNERISKWKMTKMEDDLDRCIRFAEFLIKPYQPQTPVINRHQI